ncbi:MAG: SGNH hydrolase domain-containing protein, partial [Actinomycetota bacterium]
ASQLLAGGALAFVWWKARGEGRRFVHERTASGLLVAGLVVLLVIATRSGIDPVDRGMYAAAVTVVLVLAVAARESGPVSWPERMLGSAPMERLGGLSYGTYLWHWPLVILLERTLVLGHGTTLVLVALASTGLAKLSMDLVERPVRARSHGATHRANVSAIGIGLTGTLLLGLLVVPGVLEADVDQIRAAERPGFTPAPVTITVPVEVPVESDAGQTAADAVDADAASTAAPEPEVRPAVPTTGPVPGDLGAIDVDSTYGERDGCVNVVPGSLEQCVVVEGDGTRVMLMGDSHASKLNIAFAEYAEANGFAYVVVTTNGCAWQQTLRYRDALPIDGAKRACAESRDVAYDQFVDSFAPDVIVVMSHDFATPGYTVEPRPDEPTTEGLSGDELVVTATTDAIDVLTAGGAELVIIEPIPISPFHVPGCLSGADAIEECQFVTTDWPPGDTEIYRTLADEYDAARTVDMTDLACPAVPVCSAIVDGVQVREDRDHLYAGYTLAIIDELMARIGL